MRATPLPKSKFGSFEMDLATAVAIGTPLYRPGENVPYALEVRGDAANVKVPLPTDLANLIAAIDKDAPSHIAIARCFERALYAAMPRQLYEKNDLHNLLGPWAEIRKETRSDGTVEMVDALKKAFTRKSYRGLLGLLSECDLNLYGITVGDRSDELTFSQCSVDDLCSAAGLECCERIRNPDQVTLLHGGGHFAHDNGDYEIDIDLLKGEGKEDRMRHAIEVLAFELESMSAFMALYDSGLLDVSRRVNWPKRGRQQTR